MRGEAYLIRYIYDFVVCFQYRSDALRFHDVLQKRLRKFSLEPEPQKTRLVEFGRFSDHHAKRKGKRMETIYFLGFTHYCTRHKGNFMVGRKTEKSRLRRSHSKLHQLMRKKRHDSLEEQAKAINRNLRGHYAYYGLGGNKVALYQLYNDTKRYWRKMLSSRSQKSYVTWEKVDKIQALFPIQRPKLILPYEAMKARAVM